MYPLGTKGCPSFYDRNPSELYPSPHEHICICGFCICLCKFTSI